MICSTSLIVGSEAVDVEGSILPGAETLALFSVGSPMLVVAQR